MGSATATAFDSLSDPPLDARTHITGTGCVGVGLRVCF